MNLRALSRTLEDSTSGASACLPFWFTTLPSLLSVPPPSSFSLESRVRCYECHLQVMMPSCALFADREVEAGIFIPLSRIWIGLNLKTSQTRQIRRKRQENI